MSELPEFDDGTWENEAIKAGWRSSEDWNLLILRWEERCREVMLECEQRKEIAREYLKQEIKEDFFDSCEGCIPERHHMLCIVGRCNKIIDEVMK